MACVETWGRVHALTTTPLALQAEAAQGALGAKEIELMNRIAGTLTRRLALLTACTAFMALPLLAQDTPPSPPPAAQTQGPPQGGPGGRGGMNPERRLAMMKEQLGLSDDQTAKVKAIMDESRGKIPAPR